MSKIKRWILLLALLVLAAGLSSCGNRQAQNQEEVRLIVESLLAKGEYSQAAKKAEALAENGDSALLSAYCRACGAGEQGEYDTAIAALKELGDYRDSAKAAAYYAARQMEDMAAASDAKPAEDRIAAAKAYEALKGFRDSGERAEACMQAAYEDAMGLAEQKQYEEAKAAFSLLGDYRDSANRIRKAEADALYDAGDREGAFAIYGTLGEEYQTHAADLMNQYDAAGTLKKQGKYEEAALAYEALGDYMDSAVQVTDCRYLQAGQLLEDRKYDEAEALYASLSGYLDSQTQISECRYRKAADLAAEGKTEEAQEIFTGLGDYRDSADYLIQEQYRQAAELARSGKYREAIAAYEAIADYKDSRLLAAKAAADELYDSGDLAGAWTKYKELDAAYQTHLQDYQTLLAAAEEAREAGQYDEAELQFLALGTYEDSDKKAAQCRREKADDLLAKKRYDEAEAVYAGLGDDPDSAGMVTECRYRKAGALMEDGRLEEAEALFESLNGYKDSGNCLQRIRGDRLFNKGDLAGAWEYYRQMDESLQANKKTYEDIYTTAGELRAAGQYDQARQQYAALGSYRDAAALAEACLADKGDAYMAGHYYTEALQVYEELNDPEKINECHYRYAVYLRENKHFDHAIRQFSLCEDYRDSAKQISSMEGEALLAEKKYAEARAAFAKAEENEKVLQVWDLEGEALLAEKKYAEAREAFAEAKEDEKIQRTWDLEGEALLTDGKYAEARKAFAEAKEDGKILQTWDLEGETLLTDGKYAEARKAFAEAKEDEKILQAWNLEGETLLAGGKYTEAQKAFTEAGNRSRYEDAVFGEAKALLEAGDAKASYERLQEIAGREDVKEYIRDNPAFFVLLLKPGQILKLGSFEQDNDPENGKEPIEWLVLAVEDGKALIISCYALDCRPYNTNTAYITWEDCTLRQWLNESFLKEAFTAEQQAAILTTSVDNSAVQGNPAWKVTGGKDTEDRIFLLSYKEAELYFDGAEARMCAPTEYAKTQGAYTKESSQKDGRACCWWWLRSPGHSGKNAARIGTDGNRSNDKVSHDNICVRPVLWVNLSTGIF